MILGNPLRLGIVMIRNLVQTIAIALCSATAIFCLSSHGALAQEFNVGDRIEADPTLLGNWKPGVVLKENLKGWSYQVHLDGENDPTFCKADHIKHSNTQKNPAQAARVAQAHTNLQTPVSNSAAHSASPQTSPSTAPANRANNGNDSKPQGKGAPPAGIYNCEKISGSTYIGLGKIEIRGNTYRGIDEEGRGTFHPFSVDSSGSITWSHGLTGMPDGWSLKSSSYAGLDYKGRPLIKIYYTSKSGWNDLIDCVREK